MGKPQIYKQCWPPSLSHPWGLSSWLCPFQPLVGVILVDAPYLYPTLALNFTRTLRSQYYQPCFREKGSEAHRGEVTQAKIVQLVSGRAGIDHRV